MTLDEAAVELVREVIALQGSRIVPADRIVTALLEMFPAASRTQVERLVVSTVARESGATYWDRHN